ncbi:mechanosensitive ion channel family protein [Aureivirga marina]|uniref:mechanosensitive ion channel family protein n=1 Tax=Aureivirga marina TaxID=1182451 RepID=UPI0018CBE8D0|nr:mechanosensitive ion channel domain-containing protein [Aureivirga marina]
MQKKTEILDKTSFIEKVDTILQSFIGVPKDTAMMIREISGIILLLIFAFIVWRIAQRILHKILPKMAMRTSTMLDDIFLTKRVINSISHLVPAILIDIFAPSFFHSYPKLLPLIIAVTDIFIVVIIAEIIINFIKSVKEHLESNPKFKDKPIASLSQLARSIIVVIATILIISISINESPIALLTGLGAMAAIIMLAFKDSILGFVGSIQLSLNDMVRVGDWVTLPKYGADGNVLEINLTTIKIQNFDKTITTVPTYAFISDSFRNWRGMEESDGRRIKRAINIKISSVKFCSKEMLERLKGVHLITEYIEEKQKEILTYNEQRQLDTSLAINGRAITNIGLFRKYLELYLEKNPNINHKMTCMVRQLPLTEVGIPIEVYAFCNNKDWVAYEGIMSDIFDHIMASVPLFELEIFQSPTGADFSDFLQKTTN